MVDITHPQHGDHREVGSWVTNYIIRYFVLFYTKDRARYWSLKEEDSFLQVPEFVEALLWL